MTVKVFMYPKEKINYDKSLFEDYHLGLYQSYNNVIVIKDAFSDYRLYDKEDDVITFLNKKQFYLEIH